MTKPNPFSALNCGTHIESQKVLNIGIGLGNNQFNIMLSTLTTT